MSIWSNPVPCAGETPEHWSGLVVMAATVCGEAEGESMLGKRAVAYVIKNRVADSRWPDTVNEVCLQPKQFSCWNVGSPRVPSMMNPRGHVTEAIWDECFRAALDAEFALEPDPTRGANCYLAPASLKILPMWAREEKVVAKIGHQVFYKL